MARSRGELTTKIHALVDACGLPILLKITEGQTHDGRSAQDMIGTVKRGDVLLAAGPTTPTPCARPWPHATPEPM